MNESVGRLYLNMIYAITDFRIFDVFAASHRKNKNPVRVLMKPKKGSAVTENGGELYRKRGCGNREPWKNQAEKHALNHHSSRE